MGIFTHHGSTSSNAHRFQMGENQTTDQSSSQTSQGGASSAEHDQSSSHKSACGCGCGHKAKPVDEEVLEVKEEEWDY